MSQPVTPQTVEALAQLVRLPLAPEEAPPLAAAFGELLERLARLQSLDLGETEPAFIVGNPLLGKGEGSLRLS